MRDRRNIISSVFCVVAAGLAVTSPARGFGPVAAGDDAWVTPCGGTYDDIPIPAGFFDDGAAPDGSDPVAGISLGGEPFITAPPLAAPIDTIVRRGATSSGFACGSTETIPIEIVALSLRSCSPITVTYNGGLNPEDWDVDVCLDVGGGPQPVGQMTINHECEQGGSYAADLPVRAILTFTRQSDLLQRTVVHRVDMQSSGSWAHNDPGFGLVTLNAGDVFDDDCNLNLEADDPQSIGSQFFYPGLWSPDCTSCTASPSYAKPMTPEQARLAAHGIYVANEFKPRQIDTTACLLPGGGCIDADSDTCTLRGGTSAGAGTKCSTTCPPEVCNDNVDNDCDLATDCADPDCASDPNCTATSCDRNATGTGCTNFTCPVPPGGNCVPTKIRWLAGSTQFEVLECDCASGNECRVDFDPAVGPICVGGCPTPVESCNLEGLDLDGDGVDDCFECNCRGSGACCLPDGSCQVTKRADCLNQGGTYHGDGTSCGGDTACCLDVDPTDKFQYETCDVVDRLCCGAAGGLAQPAMTCTSEACCLDNGSCRDLDPSCCSKSGGTPQGAGTSCSTDPNQCVTPYENWVIADDFCIECQCQCDINNDGLCGLKDISLVVNCYQTGTYPKCRSADLDCDGDVDFDDIRIMRCLFSNPTDPDSCCPKRSLGIDRIRWYGSYIDPAFEPDPNGTNREVDSWLLGLHRDVPPVACPPAPTGTTPFDLCGRVRQCTTDPNRWLFTPKGSGFTYELVGSIAPFVDGDELRVCGYIVPNVKRRCPGTIDVVVINTVHDCATKHSRPRRLAAQWVFPNSVVKREPTGKVGWDGHPIWCYTVDLPEGCLDHNFLRPAEYDPTTGIFHPIKNRTYWLSVQAAVGHTVQLQSDGTWLEVDTGNAATQDFWGWHTTPPGYQHKDDAFMGSLAMSCTDPMRWEYHWMGPLHCSDPRFRDCCDDPTKSIDMAFYLIRTQRVCVGGPVAGQPCVTDVDCAEPGTTGGWCVERERIEWCQPVNPLRPRPFPRPISFDGNVDEFSETAADIVINLPGLKTSSLHLTGPTVVRRNDAVRLDPGPKAPEPMQPARIDTEIIAMDLRGGDTSLGDVRLVVSNIGSSGQDGVRRQSGGLVVSNIGSSGKDGVRGTEDDPVAMDVFFDVWVEVELPQQGIFALSEGPVRLEAEIFELPPTDVKFQSAPEPVNLIDAESGAVIGSIKSVVHCVPSRGGINIHSDVDWNSSPIDDCCEPDDTSSTGCTPTVCPNADEECIPTEFTVDPATGVTTVSDCDCERVDPPPEDCHLVEVAGADPTCEGVCPNGLVCPPVPVAEVQADGTIKHRCPCDPVAKEACCLFDGTCIEVTDPDECCAQGGTPQGPNTDCTTVNCPPPDPLEVGANWDIHMDIQGEIANDFHVEGIIKSTCAPKLLAQIADLFPNFTHTITPLGGDHYEFKADWSGADVQYCQVLHLGLLFEVCCRNVMIDLVGWWTFDGNRIGGGAVADTILNEGYWPFIGFDVQDCIPPPPEPPVCEPRVLLQNNTGLGSPIAVELVELQLVSLPSPIPFEELRVGGQQEGLNWQPVVDAAGKPVVPTNPIPMLAGDEIMVLLRPAPGAVAGIPQYSADVNLGPGEYLYVRGLMQFDGNSPATTAGAPELQWFFDVHEAHNLPAPEACCLPDGTCIEVTRQECICAGGTPQGAGTLCDSDGDGVDDACDQTCEPLTDATACKRVVCPDDPNGLPNECKVKCVVFDPTTGTSSVTECDCIGPDDCHVEFVSTEAGGAGAVAGAGSGPCVVADDGSGTVTLPPEGCEYLSPDEVHEIIMGLPSGTTIELGAIHKDFICGERADLCTFPTVPGVDCDDTGGSLGGEQECASSTMELALNGNCPGALCGFSHNVSLPVDFETHIGPRVPGDAVQSFDTDMFRLQGELPTGDPHFDVLRIRAGTDFGLPSPGHTTLTRLGPPGSSFAVDSFFDIEYQIDFEGAPGGALDGLAGTTTGKIRMSTGGEPVCKGVCPADQICVETTTVRADGTIEVCCDCQDQTVPCQPTADELACEDTVCPSANERCVPTLMSLDGRVLECGCEDPDACHGEIVQQSPTAPPQASCAGKCTSGKSYCARVPVDSDGDGTRDAFKCRCRPRPLPPILVPGLVKANRSFGIEHEDIGDGVAGGPPPPPTAIHVTLSNLYDTALGCPVRTAPPLSAFNGEARWFGPPDEFPDESSPPIPNFIASELVCCPTFRDWSSSALGAEFNGAGGIPGDPDLSAVHAYGAAVAPCSEYEIRIVEFFCPDLSDPDCYSDPVTVSTALWGDTWAPFGTGNVNVVDITKLVDKFRGVAYVEGPPEAGAPPKVRAMLRDSTPDYTEKVNVVDITLDVDAFRGLPYNLAGPAVHCNPPTPTCP